MGLGAAPALDGQMSRDSDYSLYGFVGVFDFLLVTQQRSDVGFACIIIPPLVDRV